MNIKEKIAALKQLLAEDGYTAAWEVAHEIEQGLSGMGEPACILREFDEYNYNIEWNIEPVEGMKLYAAPPVLSDEDIS